MGIRELRAKYGKNLSGRVVVNAAIRAELPGGSHLLRALTIAYREQWSSRAARRVAEAIEDARGAMATEIARRYGLRGEIGE